MALSNKEIKQRYFDRIYNEAPLVPCACGCGEMIKNKDEYGRDKNFINGHNNKKYSDPTQYKREWNHNHRTQRQEYKHQYVQAFKAELINDAGGKCSLCGLPFDGECSAVFEFHHLDPKTKDFNVNNASVNKHSKDRIREETQKCELVCANCHRLIHWNWRQG